LETLLKTQMTIINFRIARFALLLGPLWFGAVILFAGAYTPGYSHSFQAISELAAPGTPYAWLVRFGGFIPLGLAFVFFALAAWSSPGTKNRQKLICILFILTGLAIIAAGIFPTDVHGRRSSFSGMAHAIAGLILLMLISITPLVVAFSVSWRSRWCGFKLFSMASGLVLIALFALLPNGISPAWIQLQKVVLGSWFTLWYQYQGLDQRALFLVYFLWLFTFVSLGVIESRERL
jgi:hypothetical membrane protein